MQQLLFVVDEVMFIKGRGLVLTPGLPLSGETRTGDILETRSADGDAFNIQIKSIDWLRRTNNQLPIVQEGQPGLLLTVLPKGAVKRGDEVWSTELQSATI